MTSWKVEKSRGVTTVELDSFKDFTAFVTEKHWNTHGVVFRGQRVADWCLEPTLLRVVRSNLPEEYRNNRSVLEGAVKRDGLRAKESFRVRSRYFDRDWRNCSDEELWALMQHHGGPTPLLDWTKSPFIAAFWALADVALNTPSSERSGRNVAVWGLHCGAIHDLSHQVNEQIGFRVVMGALPANRRLIAQQGLFTLMDPVFGIDDWVREHHEEGTWQDTYLEKLLLPWEEADRALTSLNRMNINFATMYPDLHGAALHAKLNSLSPGYEGLNPSDELLIDPRPL